MVLGETGLLKVRQKKGQAVGPFRVALGCFMIDAVKMAINSQYHSAWRTSLDHKPILARKRGTTLGDIKSPRKAGFFLAGAEGGIDSRGVASATPTSSGRSAITASRPNSALRNIF